MITRVKSEKGQAIVLIAFAIIGLLSLVALAMDGGHAFSDRRQAQNAVDAAALAVALAYQNDEVPADRETKGLAVALANGYPNDSIRSTVVINADGATVAGMCPGGKDGKEFVVTLDSFLSTWFAPIIGVPQVHNRVTATARGCEYHYSPYFDGNTIVGLAPKPNPSFHCNGSASNVRVVCDGTPTGGIFANGNATKSGGPTVISPSLTVIGTSDYAESPGGIQDVVTAPASEAYAYPMDILDMMPRTPACNGTARLVSGVYYPDLDTTKDGSKIPAGKFNGDNTFAAGVYCVMRGTKFTQSLGDPWKNTLVGVETTFFIMDPDFDLKLAGSGDSLRILAPTTGEYAGYAIVLPFTCGGVMCNVDQVKAKTQTVDPCEGSSETPRMDMRGNGLTGITGAVWAPSACVTMKGNSGTVNHGQIVAYYVNTGGSGNFDVCFKAPENPQEYFPPTLELVK